MKDKIKPIYLAVLLYPVLFVAGLYISHFLPSNNTGRAFTLRENDSNYKLINPLLLCNPTDEEDDAGYKGMNDKIKNFLSGDSAPKDSEVSVYFRDLNSGRVSGINENTLFTPASLLKVPVMIAYFKLSESNQDLMYKTLLYDGSFDDNKGEIFKTKNDIAPGVHTIKDLLKSMVVDSDNNAFHLLVGNLAKENSKIMDEVFAKLNFSIPSDISSYTDFMSAKSYSYFFRVLYNATYLNKEDSQKALDLLAGPDFPQGIKSGIPDDVVVAQKFGERSVFSPDGKVLKRELHDCGIVYATAKPYFLCVMTKGSEFKDLLPVIQGVSRIVYDSVTSGNK